MPTAVKDQLWRLVKSLSKAEKRNFKLYATRGGSTTDNKFIQLFDVIDRFDAPDDDAITKRLRLSSGQYSNLKRHLYQQVLTSLRLIYINKEIDIELREQIDFSHILYGKGLYLDALRSLERAKGRAVEHNRDLLHLEILEFQKLIEARHITLSRQIDNKMDLLLNESAERSYSVLHTSELFNLNIQIHGRYIETGHSRTPADYAENKTFWHSIQTRRNDRDVVSSTFHQKINRFQATMWYHYIQLNFEDALESALNALTLFRLSTHMTVKDPDLYMRCLYYVSVFSYLHGDLPRMHRYLKVMADFLADDQMVLNENSRRIGSNYFGLMQLNHYFVSHEWERARSFGKSLVEQYDAGEFQATDHRWGQFLYKLAAACFVLRRHDEALDYLNEIINMKTGILRQDLLLNTRLLHLICNFELGNRALADYHLTNFTRQMRRSSETAEIHRTAAAALRRLLKTADADHLNIYRKLDEDIRAAAAGDPFEFKALLYLDLTHWVGYHLPESESQGPQRIASPNEPFGVSPSAPAV
ncbi:tetratricopeptide (TPR) repeat protein [Lewinella aquimaris]|uniref:Tetratricopeptide (TPR) repeat protein n=1 Tax=Neolewinella aquimaris TaxID=1835722 RepID=A0A840E5X1_9BACT|nr:hypothetical protein [Neolewinella aquimaris]MBB4081044.1 tetratricopeptide (TPR) repeat protein [Neolewinella aquimaris]